MSEILFFKEETAYSLPDETTVKDWIRDCIEQENKKTGNINFILCSDPYLLNINQRYLNHDFFTDIITFDQSESSSEISGDIYISVDRVKENAGKLKVKFEHELCRVLIHGILHLVGYNDKTDSEKSQMREKEEACLSLRNWV